MAFWYRRSRQDFFPRGPANRIHETEYGYTTGPFDHLYYPNVSTCTALTVLLADGTALGAHLAVPDTTAEVDAILTEMGVRQAGRAVREIYLVGFPRKSGGEDSWKSAPNYRWPVALRTFNTAFGRQPQVPIRGYVQPENSDWHYCGDVLGNAMAWYYKAGNLEIASGGWKPVELSPM
jgi:hypothetical protein